MYLTSDAQGQELCLRPDLTIPVSREYLASAAAGKAQGYCYLGPVFRQSVHSDKASEFCQPGSSPSEHGYRSADAEMLALDWKPRPTTVLRSRRFPWADVALLQTWWLRLTLLPPRAAPDQGFQSQAFAAQDIDRLPAMRRGRYPDITAFSRCPCGLDPRPRNALVTDLLSIAGHQHRRRTFGRGRSRIDFWNRRRLGRTLAAADVRG